MRTKLQARVVAVSIFLVLIWLCLLSLGESPAIGPACLFITVVLYRGLLKPNPNRLYKTKSEVSWWRRGLFKKKNKSSEVTDDSINKSSHQEESLTFTSTYSVGDYSGDSTDKWYKRRSTINYILLSSIILNVLLGTFFILNITNTGGNFRFKNDVSQEEVLPPGWYRDSKGRLRRY